MTNEELANGARMARTLARRWYVRVAGPLGPSYWSAEDAESEATLGALLAAEKWSPDGARTLISWMGLQGLWYAQERYRRGCSVSRARFAALKAGAELHPWEWVPQSWAEPISEIDSEGKLTLADHADATDARVGPAEQSQAREAAAVLARVVSWLPRRERWLLEQRFWNERTRAELADAVGCSVSLVDLLHARALRRCREMLARED